VIDDVPPGPLRNLFAKHAALLRLRPFAPIHVQGQPDDQCVPASGRRRTKMSLDRRRKPIEQQLPPVGANRTLNHFERRHQPRLAIPKRESGPFIAKVYCKVAQAESR
jgi:hypothetical protein